MLPRLIWMLVLVRRSSWKLLELPRGQMSLSPENGEMLTVFFCPAWGKLSLMPPSTYRCRGKERKMCERVCVSVSVSVCVCVCVCVSVCVLYRSPYLNYLYDHCE